MRILYLAVMLSPGWTSAAAQCEVPLPDLGTLTRVADVALGQDRSALVGNGNQLTMLERRPAGWIVASQVQVPGAYVFEEPSVALDGERVFVGMRENGPNINLAGSVFVYDLATGWQQPLPISDPLSAPEDNFGASLAAHSGTLFVGAPMYVQWNQVGPGKLVVFEEGAGGWSALAEFQPHDFGEQLCGFGRAIAFDGVTAAVGAAWDDEQEPGAGAVYLYERGPGGWVEREKLHAQPAVQYGFFGEGLDVDGDTLAVGSPGGGAGAVYVYRRQGGRWLLSDVLQAPDGQLGDFFGATVDLDGNRLAVSATRVDAGGANNVGAVYVFERAQGAWGAPQKLEDPAAQAYDQLGSALSLRGNQLLWSGAAAYDQTHLHSLGIARSATTCTTLPNSSGSAAVITAEGCDSVLAGSLTLALDGAPPGELALLLFSDMGAQTPFGNGNLCLAAPIRRLGGGAIDAGGHLELGLDFSAPPASELSAGGAWHFQAFFRDPGFGAGLGTSDGVAVLLQP